MSKVAIKGNASGTGTFTLEAPNSNTDRTLVLPDEAGTVVTTGGTGSVTADMLNSTLDLTGKTVTLSGESTVATTTSWVTSPSNPVDFTGIPSWANRIIILFNGVSPSSDGEIYVQFGTSSGLVTSGYNRGSGYYSTSGTFGSGSSSSNGIYWDGWTAAANTMTGTLTVERFYNNRYFFHGVLHNEAYANFMITNRGFNDLGGVLDRVRIGYTGGGAFDAGQIAVRYE